MKEKMKMNSSVFKQEIKWNLKLNEGIKHSFVWEPLRTAN